MSLAYLLIDLLYGFTKAAVNIGLWAITVWAVCKVIVWIGGRV